MNQQSSIATMSISDSLGKAWQTVKKNIWLMAGFTMIYFIVSGLLNFAPILGRFTSFFGFIFSASFFAAAQYFEQKGQLEFNHFFTWSPKFGRLFLGNLVLILVFIALVIPLVLIIIGILGFGFFTSVFENPQEIASLVSSGTILLLVLFLFLFFLAASLVLFAYPFVIQFTDLSFSESLRYSFKIGRNNLGQILYFALIAILLTLLGFLCLGIGVLVTIPLIVLTQYYFLKSVIGNDEPEQEWDFMQQKP